MEFEETLEVFYFFGIIHCKVAAILVASFGLLSIVGLAGAGVAFFEWWRHETAIDVIAMIGFSIFLVGGIAAHSTLLYALQNTRARLVVPFVVFHCFMIAVNSITALIAVGEIVSDQSPEVESTDQVARLVVIALPLASAFEILMLIVVFRARWYLRLRARYLRNGRPPRVHHTRYAGFSLASVLGRNKRAEDSSTTGTAPSGAPTPNVAPAGANNRVAPAELELGAIVVAPDGTPPPPVPVAEQPRKKVVAIRVPTPPQLKGDVFPLGRMPPPSPSTPTPRAAADMAESGPL